MTTTNQSESEPIIYKATNINIIQTCTVTSLTDSQAYTNLTTVSQLEALIEKNTSMIRFKNLEIEKCQRTIDILQQELVPLNNLKATYTPKVEALKAMRTEIVQYWNQTLTNRDRIWLVVVLEFLREQGVAVDFVNNILSTRSFADIKDINLRDDAGCKRYFDAAVATPLTKNNMVPGFQFWYFRQEKLCDLFTVVSACTNGTTVNVKCPYTNTTDIPIYTFTNPQSCRAYDDGAALRRTIPNLSITKHQLGGCMMQLIANAGSHFDDMNVLEKLHYLVDNSGLLTGRVTVQTNLELPDTVVRTKRPLVDISGPDPASSSSSSSVSGKDEVLEQPVAKKPTLIPIQPVQPTVLVN